MPINFPPALEQIAAEQINSWLDQLLGERAVASLRSCWRGQPAYIADVLLPLTHTCALLSRSIGSVRCCLRGEELTATVQEPDKSPSDNGHFQLIAIRRGIWTTFFNRRYAEEQEMFLASLSTLLEILLEHRDLYLIVRGACQMCLGRVEYLCWWVYERC